jgi:hypothetical protein
MPGKNWSAHKDWIVAQEWIADKVGSPFQASAPEDGAMVYVGRSAGRTGILGRVQSNRRRLGAFFGFASMLPVASDEVCRLPEYEQAAIDEIQPKFNLDRRQSP